MYIYFLASCSIHVYTCTSCCITLTLHLSQFLYKQSCTTDKLIIFFTSASNLYVNSGENFDGVLTNVSVLNAGLMNKVVISAYVVDQDGDIFGNVDQRIKKLVEQPIVSVHNYIHVYACKS